MEGVRALRGFLLLFAAALAGCACHGGPDAFVRSAPGEAWVRTELFFGLSRPDGTTLSPADWQGFLDSVVTPRFPAGLTVVDGQGRWRNAAGQVVSEPSKVLILFHPPDPALNARIEEIRSLYRAQFRQESVLRSTSPAKVSF